MRISIAYKIFSIALTLLLLLAVVAVLSIRNISQVRNEVRIVASYFAPLSALVGRLQILQLEQEAEIERLRRLSLQTPPDVPAIGEARERLRRLAVTFDEEVASGTRLAEEGLGDGVSDSDRVEFAQLSPVLRQIERQHQEFEDLASRIAAALDEGAQDRVALLEEILDKEAADFNAELDSLRAHLDVYTQESEADAAEQESEVLRLNLIITIAAAVSGLLFASLITSGLVRPIRRLVRGTQAVEQGNLDTEIRVTSTDEIGALALSFNNMVGQLRIKERIKTTFGKYVDPRIVEDLLERPDTLAVSGDRRDITVFFSDIEGFTAIGEHLTPGGLVTVINHYFTLMSEPIARHGGIIDKYIGDAIMAFWTTPFVAAREHALHACLAALEQLDKLAELHRVLPDLIGVRQAVPAINIRIGIATGDAVVGNIGSDRIKGYTVMGDTVNLGSRLEGAGKQYGVRILISEGTHRLAGDGIETRELDTIRVAGKTEPVRIFELLARRGELDPGRAALRERFREALAAYRAGQWDEAERLFEACLSIQPADGPARMFLTRLARLRGEGTPRTWDGVWTLAEK